MNITVKEFLEMKMKIAAIELAIDYDEKFINEINEELAIKHNKDKKILPLEHLIEDKEFLKAFNNVLDNSVIPDWKLNYIKWY